MTKTTLLGALALGLTLSLGCGSPATPATPDPATTAAPADQDSDSDGVPDSADKCPDKKEDGLGPQPKDGCPNTAAPAKP